MNCKMIKGCPRTWFGSVPIALKALFRVDPNREMVLEAAINGRANALVTYNVADFDGPAERFRISVLRPGDLLKEGETMSKATYPLKLPLSIKKAAQRLAKEDGVSLNQWIAAAVA